MRVASKNAPSAPAVPAPAEKKDKKDDKAKGPEYAFEDTFPLDLKVPEAGQPFRFSRAFSVPAGDYDVVIVLKERAPIEKDKKVKNPVYKYGLAEARGDRAELLERRPGHQLRSSLPPTSRR